MLIINNEIDLGKSFEKLKSELKESLEISGYSHAASYARAYGFLESAVKKHLIVCTDMSGEELNEYLKPTT